MTLYLLALTGAGREAESVPAFESMAALRAWLPAYAAAHHCQRYGGGRARTASEELAVLADAYGVDATPNGLWAAAVRWAAETGRGEWAIIAREPNCVGPDGRALSPPASVTALDDSYAESTLP